MFSSGSLFIAKCARPHEQSVAGALFSVMTQVLFLFPPTPPLSSCFGSLPCRDGAWMASLSDASAGHELMSIGETHGRFVRCWLIAFLI